MMRDAQICWTRDGGRTKCIIKMPFLDFFEILSSTVIDPFRWQKEVQNCITDGDSVEAKLGISVKMLRNVKCHDELWQKNPDS